MRVGGTCLARAHHLHRRARGGDSVCASVQGTCGRGFVRGTEFPKVPVGPERTNLQYELHVDILQHGYDACATKYGRLARLVPSEIQFFVQNLLGT